MTHPNTDQGVTAEDREAAQRLADWLLETTKGAVRVVATDDTFFPIQAFARHRLSSTAALEAEVERWHDAYCIAHDQAMSNGEAYQDAAAQIASLKQRLESAEHAMEMALKCTPFIRSTQSQFHGVGRLHEIAYECGDPWEILRAFLQEQEKLPDSVAFLATTHAEAGAARIADNVVPEFRTSRPIPSCTGLHANRWNAAYEAALAALTGKS